MKMSSSAMLHPDSGFYDEPGSSSSLRKDPARIPLNAASSTQKHVPPSSSEPSRLSAFLKRPVVIIAFVTVVAVWLVVLSAELTKLLNQTTVITNIPIVTTLGIASIGCSGSSILEQGTPVSLFDREPGSILVGAGTTSYVGGSKLALPVPQVGETQPILVALDSSTALLIYSTTNGQGYAVVVPNGGVPAGVTGQQQWLSGQTISPTPQLMPFFPDAGILLSRSFATTNYLIAFTGGNGQAVVAYVLPGGKLQFGNVTRYAQGQYSMDAKMTALDDQSFAISYYDNTSPTSSEVALFAAVALVNTAQLTITMSTPVMYTGNHEFHGIARVINNAVVLTFPRDNATAIVNDDDESVGYAMQALVATVSLKQQGSTMVPELQVWGKKGAGGTPGKADQRSATPWTLSSVLAHSFYRVAEAPVPAQIQVTGQAKASRPSLLGGTRGTKPLRLSKRWDPQQAAAHGQQFLKQQQELGSAITPITSPFIFRQIAAMTVVDRGSSDAVRAITMAIYILSEGGTFSPSQQAFNVTDVDVLFGDTGLVTAGGASGGYRQMELASFPILPVSTINTPTVTFAVTLAEMSAQAAAMSHLFEIHLLDARISLPSAKYAAPQSAVDPSGVIVAPANANVDPISGEPAYLLATVPMQGISGILVAAIPNPTTSTPSAPLLVNLTLVEHLGNPIGVLEINGNGIACAPGQLTSVIMAGSTGPQITAVVQPPVNPLTPGGGANQQTTSLIGGLTAYATTRGGLTTSRGYSVVYSASGGGTNGQSSLGIDVHVGSDSAIGTALADGSVLVG
jgi:hypothetical protein